MRFGVDTIQLFTKDKGLRNKIDTTSFNYLASGCRNLASGTNIALRPHDKNNLATYDEAMEFILALELELDTKFYITRLDLSYNIDLDIDQHKQYQYARYLIESIAKKKGISKVLETKLNESVANVKVKTKNKEISFYNAKDKRDWNSRLEFRFKNLIVEDLKAELDNRLKEIKIDLYSCEQLDSELSSVLADRYIKLFKKEIKNKEIANFKNFLVRYEKNFLSREMFDLVYEQTGLNTPSRVFLSKYKESGQNLNFVDEKVYLEFTKLLIKNIIKFKEGGLL